MKYIKHLIIVVTNALLARVLMEANIETTRQERR